MAKHCRCPKNVWSPCWWTTRKTSFTKHNEIFDEDELVADGYFDRHENIAVISAYRLDRAYAALDKITGPMWKIHELQRLGTAKGQGWSRE